MFDSLKGLSSKLAATGYFIDPCLLYTSIEAPDGLVLRHAAVALESLNMRIRSYGDRKS